MKAYRADALEDLFAEVAAFSTPREKLERFADAKKMALFREHRNNSIFTGAWGRTGALREIDKKMQDIRDLLPSKNCTHT